MQNKTKKQKQTQKTETKQKKTNKQTNKNPKLVLVSSLGLLLVSKPRKTFISLNRHINMPFSGRSRVSIIIVKIRGITMIAGLISTLRSVSAL